MEQNSNLSPCLCLNNVILCNQFLHLKSYALKINPPPPQERVRERRESERERGVGVNHCYFLLSYISWINSISLAKKGFLSAALLRGLLPISSA